MPPKSSSKPASGGVLPIPAAATKKNSPQQSKNSTTSPAKAAAPRLKLLVRRLPPGLTQAEFDTAVGEEWAVGKGKVDYFLFKEGKVSKDPSKPSRPSRAYLRVTSTPLIQELSDKVRHTSFQDARNTSHDPALLGPPTVEYAPFSRVPGGKSRKDGRLGTIDQDPDFIAFLESLTNPVTKPPPVDEIPDPEKKEEKVTITPLIQFLRDKKANKAKESSQQAKAAKQARIEAKEQKAEKVQAKKLLSRSERASVASGEKQQKAGKATKDAVKAANKQITNQAGTGNAKPSAEPPTAPAAERKRERGNASAAAKILRRDLGLGPAPPSRRQTADQTGATSAGSAETKADADKSPTSPTTTDRAKPTTTPKGGKQDNSTTQKGATSAKTGKKEPPTEPAAARNASASAPKTGNIPTGPAAAKSTPPSGPKRQEAAPSTGTQAFLKHANPSQGVTEDLLQSGFSKFGEVVRVEIDRKKGFGYVDFSEPAELKKAIQASPVQIAESQVVVLARRAGAGVSQARGNHGNNQSPMPPPPPMSPTATPPRAPPQGPRGSRGGRGSRPKGGFGGRGRGARGGGGGGKASPAGAGAGAGAGDGS